MKDKVKKILVGYWYENVKLHSESKKDKGIVLEESASNVLALFKSEMLDIVGEDEEDTFDPTKDDLGGISYEDACDILSRNELRMELREKIKSLK